MNEKELLYRKWFDYRMLTPASANWLFLQHYIRAYRDYMERRRGNRYINPLSTRRRKKDENGNWKQVTKTCKVEEAPEKWPSWKVLVELRQWADMRGMRYDDFWGWAFKAVNECKCRTFTINYCKGVKVQATIMSYHKACRLIYLSDLNFFKGENYKGYELQADYYWYLINAIQGKYPTEFIQKLRGAADDGLISLEFLQKNMKEFANG